MQFEMEVTGIADPRVTEAGVDGVRQLTQWYTSQMEGMIRQAPEQYWWLHRRWKDARPPKRRAGKAA
jgi:Kdo2-lipid IVA lauroyltransferase/acyltransferase